MVFRELVENVGRVLKKLKRRDKGTKREEKRGRERKREERRGRDGGRKTKGERAVFLKH